MTGLVPGPAELSVFLTASLLLGLTPGPDMLLVVNRALGAGFKAGMVTMAGIVTGCAVHTLAAAFGLSLLLMELPFAYDLIRFGGAAYLAFLGLQILRHGGGLDLQAPVPAGGRARLFRQALLTNLLNPKVALFILAFLPQFVPAGAQHTALRILILGALFFGIGIAIMTAMAALADRIRRWARDNPKLLRGQSAATGVLLLLFAAGLAFGGRPAQA